MLAYKGFNSDLTCTMGRGRFQYEPGKWYKEESAHCARDGFHVTDNPLDVLSYYNKDSDRYFIVNVRGNIDEDGINSRISAPEIKLVKEITKDQLYYEGVLWMSVHQRAPWAGVIEKDEGDARGQGNIIVRGKKPRAKGSIGDTIYMVREDKEGNILEIGMYKIDGIRYMPDTYYNVKGVMEGAKKKSGKA